MVLEIGWKIKLINIVRSLGTLKSSMTFYTIGKNLNILLKLFLIWRIM